jgi:CheY-like chemotaxis protein
MDTDVKGPKGDPAVAVAASSAVGVSSRVGVTASTSAETTRIETSAEPRGSGLTLGTAILGLTRDAASRDLLMEIAIDRGYGLCCAVDGAEAIRILGTEPPALVVVDIDTPDGRALLRALRANERWRGIPLLALTATNNPMIAVTVDAPVFFKPDLDGLLEAVTGRFEPDDNAAPNLGPWPRKTLTA